jgi:hypothetical protein
MVKALFECFNTPSIGVSQTIFNYPVGDELVAQITFPQCWDGVNLRIPDHKRHMAYAIRERACAQVPILLHYQKLLFDHIM